MNREEKTAQDRALGRTPFGWWGRAIPLQASWSTPLRPVRLHLSGGARESAFNRLTAAAAAAAGLQNTCSGARVQASLISLKN